MNIDLKVKIIIVRIKNKNNKKCNIPMYTLGILINKKCNEVLKKTIVIKKAKLKKNLLL